MPVCSSIPMITIGAMVKVPKMLLLNVEAEKAALTIRNGARMQAIRRGFSSEAPEFFFLYKETDSDLLVPRAHRFILQSGLRRGYDYTVADAVFARSNCSVSKVQLGEDRVTLGPNDQQPFDQGPAFEALTESPSVWPHGRILSLRCGAGKTAIALKGAHARQARTLWVTVSTSLLVQAKRNIQDWLGVPMEDIGHVQGDKLDWENKNIAVAMIHTLSARRDSLPAAFWQRWGLVVFDEGDVLGSEHFSAIAGMFPCERWLLTATRKRPDGNEAVFEKHIGPVCYEYLEHDLRPQCYFQNTTAGMDNVICAGWDYSKKERRFNFPLTARSLMFNDERTDQLFGIVRHAAGDGRTCLVLADSVPGLLHTSARARDEMSEFSHGLIVGSVSQNQRDIILHTNQVVWATQPLAYRGISRPAFDTLVFATLSSVNRSRVTQACGRVLRYAVNKKDPFVVVLVDEGIPPLLAQAAKLALIFKNEGWATHNTDMLLRKYRDAQRAWREAQNGY